MKISKERRFSIGRSPKCDIVVADDSVSRRHAELTVLENGLLFLVDCRSTQGTVLHRDNETNSFQQELLLPTDIVQFGDFKIPVKELLKEIQMRDPSFNIDAVSPPADQPQPIKPWAPGTRLACCCHCGVVTKKAELCYRCGQ